MILWSLSTIRHGRNLRCEIGSLAFGGLPGRREVLNTPCLWCLISSCRRPESSLSHLLLHLRCLSCLLQTLNKIFATRSPWLSLCFQLRLIRDRRSRGMFGGTFVAKLLYAQCHNARSSHNGMVPICDHCWTLCVLLRSFCHVFLCFFDLVCTRMFHHFASYTPNIDPLCSSFQDTQKYHIILRGILTHYHDIDPKPSLLYYAASWHETPNNPLYQTLSHTYYMYATSSIRYVSSVRTA